MIVMRPVLGVRIGQVVGLRPDAQKRIEGHQRDRGRTKGLRAGETCSGHKSYGGD